MLYRIQILYDTDLKVGQMGVQLPKHFLWQYKPQGHFFFTAFFLNKLLHMWQPVAIFLDDEPIMLSNASDVSYVDRRGRFPVDCSPHSFSS